VEAAPQNPEYPFLIDVLTRWRGRYFYFVALYRDPRPEAIVPTFEMPFARLTHVATGRFVVSYRHHTGKFFSIGPDVELPDAIDMLKGIPVLSPQLLAARLSRTAGTTVSSLHAAGA
jgi:hypothetical protein